MLTVLFAARGADWPVYADQLPRAIAATGVEARVVTAADPAEVDYIVYAPNGTLRDFAPFSRAKAVLSLWAGVETIVGNPTLTMPLARMVDPALTEGMVEYVVGHVLRHHLGMDRHILGTGGKWIPEPPPIARERRVTMLGLGELGRSCAQALAALNFPVTGWSRTQRTVAGITCLSGEAGLEQALSVADILVLLLPRTPGTENLMDARRLAMLPKGAMIVNPGRGPLIDDDALLAALDAGHVGHATLDVFRTEPLPPEHPYWAHPRVTVTPHIAADTRASSASLVIAENIRRSEAGEPLLYLVDKGAGY